MSIQWGMWIWWSVWYKSGQNHNSIGHFNGILKQGWVGVPFEDAEVYRSSHSETCWSRKPFATRTSESLFWWMLHSTLLSGWTQSVTLSSPKATELFIFQKIFQNCMPAFYSTEVIQFDATNKHQTYLSHFFILITNFLCLMKTFAKRKIKLLEAFDFSHWSLTTWIVSQDLGIWDKSSGIKLSKMSESLFYYKNQRK